MVSEAFTTVIDIGGAGSFQPTFQSKDESEDVWDGLLDSMVKVPVKTNNRIDKCFSKTIANSREEIKEKYNANPINLPDWFVKKNIKTKYTEEYLQIRRQNNIQKLLYYIDEIISIFHDEMEKLIPIELMKNYINEIYNNFLEGGQEVEYLSVIHLIENILNSDYLNKRTLQVVSSELKQLYKKRSIEYNDYKQFTGRLFELGIDFISIEDIDEEDNG